MADTSTATSSPDSARSNAQRSDATSPATMDVRRNAAELATCASIEMGAHRPEDAVRIAELLPTATRVYVNHLPRHSLDDTLAGLVAVARAGLEPVPHLAARRVRSRAEVETFLRRAVKEAGATKVLLLGGDVGTSAGPYSDAGALLREGLLRDAGIREVAFAAYPEGHPRIPTPQLWSALSEKIATARDQGMGCYVVSQFSFAPSRIVEMCEQLQRAHPDLSVYVGLPGPTNPAQLLKFAQTCGVSASLRAMTAQGMGAVRMFTHTDPIDQLLAVASHVSGGATANVVGIHVFTFGGIEPAAQWINRQIATR
jgi:methylenetetrahydrofolate reductase (NADPH)